MIEKLSQTAAMAARDGVQNAIMEMESSIKLDIKNLPERAREYFQRERDEKIAAIQQLKLLRAGLHKRAFDAYHEENVIDVTDGLRA